MSANWHDWMKVPLRLDYFIQMVRLQKEVSETFETKVEVNTFAYAKVVSRMNITFVFGLATFSWRCLIIWKIID